MIPFNIQQQAKEIDWPAWIQAGCAVLALFITGLGTLFIVKSFRQQKKINFDQREINKQQMEINRLSMEKNRREIRPYFKAVKNSALNTNISCTLYLESADAFYIYFNYQNGERLEYKNELMPLVKWSISDRKSIEFNLLDNEEMFFGIRILAIGFNDEDGRTYCQTVTYIDGEFKTDLPIQTTEELLKKYFLTPLI